MTSRSSVGYSYTTDGTVLIKDYIGIFDKRGEEGMRRAVTLLPRELVEAAVRTQVVTC
jgi:hypothetical protein